jgi:chromosome segregation ATPase
MCLKEGEDECEVCFPWFRRSKRRTLEAKEKEYEDGQYLKYDVKKYVTKISHLEEQIRELNNKIDSMKLETEQVPYSMQRSDALGEDLEEKSRAFNRKIEDMIRELEHATRSVERPNATVRHLEDQLEAMKKKLQQVRRVMKESVARIKYLEEKLEDCSKKATEGEYGNATNPVEDSDVQTKCPEHISGQSSFELEDMEGDIKHGACATEECHVKNKYLEDELRKYKQKVKDEEQKLHAAHVFQERQETEALREKEKLLKKIEIMKEGDIRVHKYFTEEIEELKKNRGTSNPLGLLDCIKKILPCRARTSKVHVPKKLDEERKRHGCQICA